MLSRLLLAAAASLTALVLGYPVAFLSSHGLSPDGWPLIVGADGLPFRGAPRPEDWMAALHHGDLELIASTYVDMFEGRSLMLAGGGQTALATIIGIVAVIVISVFALQNKIEERHHTARFGKARWATRRERSRLNRGLEIGVDRETGRPLRVAVEGNLLTIAPPRTGKTSAFILPNLADPDHRAWHGSTVVVDPKGDAYRAAVKRRTALGRTVRCLDPYDLIGGSDRWNPLQNVDADDVVRLQSIAKMLMPGLKDEGSAEQYFHTKAAGVIVAALQCAIRSGHPNPGSAAALTRNTDALAAALKGRQDAVAQSVLRTLESDPKTRDPILSTVDLAFEWALDPRAEASTQSGTFSFDDICQGTADLFIVTAADDRRDILAPYLRWLLGDLFGAVRSNKPVERIVVYIDEAFVLGRYDAILKGVGELPGYGVSLWTVWQSRAQISETYGDHGAQVLIETAEVVSLFNLSQASPDETEYWSRALGNWTAVKAGNSKTGEPDEPVSQALVPAGDLPALSQHNVIALIANRSNTTFPILCRKRYAHRDRQLRRLLDITVVRPVGAIQWQGRRRTP